MEQQGWLKLYRSIRQWEWHDDPNTLSMFIHILVSVNHDSQKWRGHVINKGQMLTTYKRLGEMTGMSTNTVKEKLNNLIKTGEIKLTDTKSAQHFKIVTVCNFDKYQNAPSKIDSTIDCTFDCTFDGTFDGTTDSTTDSTVDDITRNKEYNNNIINKEIKEYTHSSARACEESFPELVEPSIQDGEVVRVVPNYEYIFVAVRDFYEKKLNDFYTPNSNDTQAAKELNEKLKVYKLQFPQCENMDDIVFFKWVLMWFWKVADDFQRTNFDISTINKQFNKFKNKIKINESNGNNEKRKPTNDDYAEYLREKARAAGVDLNTQI